jgi:uncharacterized membrane protein YeaQ/YmgE (transglycosylase-associated protein family)
MGIFSAILLLIVAYIIFAVIIFPLLIMTIFAFGSLFPYIIGAVVLYIVWKFVKKRA